MRESKRAAHGDCSDNVTAAAAAADDNCDAVAAAAAEDDDDSLISVAALLDLLNTADDEYDDAQQAGVAREDGLARRPQPEVAAALESLQPEETALLFGMEDPAAAAVGSTPTGLDAFAAAMPTPSELPELLIASEDVPELLVLLNDEHERSSPTTTTSGGGPERASVDGQPTALDDDHERGSPMTMRSGGGPERATSARGPDFTYTFLGSRTSCICEACTPCEDEDLSELD